MLSPSATAQFKRDRRRLARRGKNLRKLDAIMRTLVRGERLGARHRRHRLSGPWQDCWECHVEPDWLMIWYETGTEIVFVRTGTHSDLFR